MNRPPTGRRVWAASGLAFVAFFAGGLLFADVFADQTFPAQSASIEEISAYFSGNGPEARTLAFFHSLAALALLVFVAGVRVLTTGGEHGARIPSAVAFGGGVMAASFLLHSALLFWTLARTSTAENATLARALHDLSFLAGGHALALTLAAFIGAASLATSRVGALPSWLGGAGIATAALSLVSLTSLLWAPARAALYFAALAGLSLGSRHPVSACSAPTVRRDVGLDRCLDVHALLP
jgi:hypothetical protein